MNRPDGDGNTRSGCQRVLEPRLASRDSSPTASRPSGALAAAKWRRTCSPARSLRTPTSRRRSVRPTLWQRGEQESALEFVDSCHFTVMSQSSFGSGSILMSLGRSSSCRALMAFHGPHGRATRSLRRCGHSVGRPLSLRLGRGSQPKEPRRNSGRVAIGQDDCSRAVCHRLPWNPRPQILGRFHRHLRASARVNRE